MTTHPHLIPTWDVVQHDSTPDCICGPTLLTQNYESMPTYWKHHAAVAHHSSRGHKSYDRVDEGKKSKK